MKKFFAHNSLIIVIAIASIWSTQTSAFAPASKHLPVRLAAGQKLQAETWNRTELYFGSSKPDGSVVSEKKFQRFVDEEVTPRFPDGLTVLTGNGQFKNSAGVILKERSMVLILLYPLEPNDSSSMKIEEIREAYKSAFQQESVLRVDSLASVSF
jgi:hypothetical protein